MKLRRSLMSKYLLLILSALLLWPIVPAVLYAPGYFFAERSLYDPEDLTSMWQRVAADLDRASGVRIDEQLRGRKDDYPDAVIFWVDHERDVHFVQGKPEGVPEQWGYEDVVAFFGSRESNAELFTLTALIGDDPTQGVMVFQVPKSLIMPSNLSLSQDYVMIALFFIICLLFLVLSWLFFVRIRKRLIRLQSAMTEGGASGIPDEIMISKQDEIGQLETAFNRMVRELKDSRHREQEEEQLRKQLISNISHDLRTPLTVIRQHAYSVLQDPVSPRGIDSMGIIVNKLDDVGELIDNLLAYTLLTAGKHPIHMHEIDVIEEMRRKIAEWHSVFEAKNMEVDVDLPELPFIWKLDPQWFSRIVDNLFQNVLRHAESGRYIGVQIVIESGRTMLVVKDKGQGMKHASPAKGAGIGLSIIALMTKEMNLQWDMKSTPNGTAAMIWAET